MTLAAAAMVAATVVGPAPPASAATTESDSLVLVPFEGPRGTVWRNGNVLEPVYFPVVWPLEGDFSAAPGGDVFYYNPGTQPDGILHVAPSGTTATTTFAYTPVNGDYRPLVGDFDGNAIDDIFWYGVGPSPDHLWRFQPDGSHTSHVRTVNGTYDPVVIDVDGKVGDDIVWYAPGPAADHIWQFDPSAAHTSRSVAIKGRYTAITGHFGNQPEGSPQDRLIWWTPTGPDHIWTFGPTGDHVSEPFSDVGGDNLTMPIVGTFTDPVLDSVLFYRPGTAAEVARGFEADGDQVPLPAPQVKGLYLPAVGDYDGNGYQDIAWAMDGKVYLWKFAGGTYTQSTIVTTTPHTLPVTAYHHDPF